MTDKYKELRERIDDAIFCSIPHDGMIGRDDAKYLESMRNSIVSIFQSEYAALLAERDQMAEALAGITQDHLDGGWTAKGLSKYAKGLEIERDALRDALMRSNAMLTLLTKKIQPDETNVVLQIGENLKALTPALGEEQQ